MFMTSLKNNYYTGRKATCEFSYSFFLGMTELLSPSDFYQDLKRFCLAAVEFQVASRSAGEAEKSKDDELLSRIRDRTL